MWRNRAWRHAGPLERFIKKVKEWVREGLSACRPDSLLEALWFRHAAAPAKKQHAALRFAHPRTPPRSIQMFFFCFFMARLCATTDASTSAPCQSQ